MPRIQLKRGNKSNLPTTGMLAGEPMVTLDRGTLHVATDATTSVPIVPAIEDLTSLAVLSTDDLLIVHDDSDTREKKVKFSDFKAALNIPVSSTDEKVAVVNGGVAGYIWGTDGTDGVLRMNSSMSWSKDAGNAFVTLAVEKVDGGTF